jgi:hypothetical protein
MKRAFKEMGEQHGQSAEMAKMDADDFLQTVVTHVSRFIPHIDPVSAAPVQCYWPFQY